MASKLVIASVERMQKLIENTLKFLEGGIGIYVSLNRTYKSLEKSFETSKINSEKIFFIDCVSSEKTTDEVLNLSPRNLDGILDAIREFNKDIPGEKFLIIDALSTLLIYNSENKVAEFVKDLTSMASNKLRLVAFSPETKGEELLDKIFNFFEEVDK